MSEKLIVVVPTFGRPQNAMRLLRAFEETCTAVYTDVMFVCDYADPARDDYPAHMISNSRGMIAALNYGARRAVDEGATAVGFMGDDHLPVTVGWDQNYLDALRLTDGGIVYGNDLIQGARIPTQVAMDARIVQTLGWMAPPTFKHLYVDDAWLAIGQALNKVTYLPETIVKHLHPLGNEAEWDEGYERVNSPHVASYDQKEYQRWRAMDLPKIKEKLQCL